MRAGACTVQQTLTSEAASVLKHSLSLARRRGHAQVTPLHVAATLLSSRASLLRRACLKSQPHHNNHHPLYSRALELCFNVALNRLPTSPGPLLHGQPSLSNALIAALKRAQAHQRRGCIEQQQQQPLLAIKVELEQLILSILDDPSVSRVMREAGFSSTAVKNNLEDSPVFPSYNTTSGGVYSSPCSPTQIETQTHTGINLFHPHFSTYSPDQNHFISPHSQTKHSDDIKLVLEVLLRKKRNNTVIVGDSVSITEGLVHQLMGKIARGDMDVPTDLKSAHFIKFHFSSLPLRFMRREEVELNLSDLKKKVDSLGVGGRGVIIYTGDMKWTVDDSSFGDGYSPVDHLVNEIGKLVTEYGNSNTKVWLMATANYQTYMRCQMRQPPLEIQWGLQAVSVPSGGLGLSLNVISVHESRMTFSQNPSQLHERKPLTSKEEQDMATCCAECTANYEKEAAMFKAGHYKPSSLYSSPCKPKNMDNVSNNLPSWLQSHGSEVLERDELANLRRKWNTLCRNLHHERHTHNHNINSSLPNNFSYPWWPNSNPNSPLRDTNSISFTDSTLKPSLPRFRRQQSCHIEFSFTNVNNKEDEPNLDSLKTSEEGKELKITLALGNGNSLSSDNGKIEDLRPKDGDYICSVLLDNVHWHLDSIPLIAESLVKKDTWFLFEGNDSIGKRRLGRAIAKAVFGSADLLFSMNTRRETEVEKLKKALVDHEKLVVLVEDIDFADNHLVKFLGDQLEAMKIGESNKRERICGEKIFILTKGDHLCDGKKIRMKLEVNEGAFGNKRRAEWNLLKENKIPKINDKNDESHSHALDLNIKADEDEERDNEEEDHGEFSPNSSDLTRENAVDLPSQLRFLESIRNRFVFNRDSDMDSQLRDMFLSRITDSFERVFSGEEMAGCFTAEKGVLEEVLLGCGSFLNGLFEKWLKDIFQTSLQTVKIGGKGVSMRLCLGGEGGIESGLGDVGFMGSNLPKKIQVSFMH